MPEHPWVSIQDTLKDLLDERNQKKYETYLDVTGYGRESGDWYPDQGGVMKDVGNEWGNVLDDFDVTGDVNAGWGGVLPDVTGDVNRNRRRRRNDRGFRLQR